jgi:hypothetical protein
VALWRWRKRRVCCQVSRGCLSAWRGSRLGRLGLLRGVKSERSSRMRRVTKDVVPKRGCEGGGESEVFLCVVFD